MFRKVAFALCMLMLFSVVATDEQSSKDTKTPSENVPVIVCDCGISGDSDAIKEFPGNHSGGKEVRPHNKYPWMVSLVSKKNDTHLCGGIIVSPLFVLTAAHCFIRNIEYIKDLDPPFEDCATPDEVLAPCYDKASDIEVYYQAGERLLFEAVDIEDRWIHEEFGLSSDNLRTLTNDIALIKVKEPFPCDENIRPICLPLNMSSLEIGENIVVSGWRRYNAKIPRDSLVLMETTLQMKDCTKDWGASPTHFCAQANETGDCFGDGGGPAFATVGKKFYTFGISSFASHNCYTEMSGRYVDVTSFMKWIVDHMKKNSDHTVTTVKSL